jgi:hypothetical protein
MDGIDPSLAGVLSSAGIGTSAGRSNSVGVDTTAPGRQIFSDHDGMD